MNLTTSTATRKSDLLADIGELLRQPNYPCVAAIQAYHKGEIRTGLYSNFGSGQAGRALRADLALYIREYLLHPSPYLSFWAAFDGPATFSDEEFELRLWNELSHLSSAQTKNSDWGQHPSDPKTKNFAFCLFGESLFAVGLHPGSNRPARRFPRPSIVFNLFAQFDELKRRGEFFPMVSLNRTRDKKFSGRENPMALEHGEKWESIQFSGRQNAKNWRCPFRFRE